MFFKKHFASMQEAPPSLDRRGALAGVPVFNPEARCVGNAAGTLTLIVTVRRRAGFLGKFQPREWERKIELDELGSFIIEQIDGERSALEIVEAFVRRFKLNRREAELSTMQFIKSLIERNAIAIALPRPMAEAAGVETEEMEARR